MARQTPAIINAPHAPFWDRHGNQISHARWSELMGDDDYFRVGNTGLVVRGVEVRVTTFWCGWCLGGQVFEPPMLFETSVMGGVFNGMAWLFATEPEARLGHQVAVELARGGGADRERLLRSTEALVKLRQTYTQPVVDGEPTVPA